MNKTTCSISEMDPALPVVTRVETATKALAQVDMMDNARPVNVVKARQISATAIADGLYNMAKRCRQAYIAGTGLVVVAMPSSSGVVQGMLRLQGL